jgi:pyrroline-5-carboxylate reductase
MLKQQTIGFIGAGNMGQALIGGLIDNQVADPGRIVCSDANPSQVARLAERFGIRGLSDNRSVVQQADLVIYAVKPQILPRVIQEIAPELSTDKVIISIAAGVPIATMESLMPEGVRLVRAMPNVCVTVREGMTALVPGSCARDADLDLAQTVFAAVGRTVRLQDEALMDAVTGLSGSGPAYAFLIIEALADGGVRMGLPRSESLLLAAQTVLGAAKLLVQSDRHPAQLKDMVTSPGGTTIAGLNALEKGAVRHALMQAVADATQRSIELGRLANAKK